MSEVLKVYPLYESVLDDATKAAHKQKLSLAQYAGLAARLLNRVHGRGIHPKTTKLLAGNHEVPLRPLSSRANTNSQDSEEYVEIHFPSEHDQRQFEAQAEKTGITSYERMNRALRLANYLVTNEIDDWENPVFVRDNQRIELPTAR